jgi:hypothetical protein
MVGWCTYTWPGSAASLRLWRSPLALVVLQPTVCSWRGALALRSRLPLAAQPLRGPHLLPLVSPGALSCSKARARPRRLQLPLPLAQARRSVHP